MTLKDKVYIVTGAASGMGEATTDKFEREGAKIIAVDYNEAVTERWAGHENVTTVVADVTNLDDIKKMVAVTKETYGKLDGVCNIAGINDRSYPLLDVDDERWDRVMDLDLKAPFRILREAMPLMIENGGGSIVNIGSYAALRGNHGVTYTAAKAGLEGLTKSLAFCYAKDNIRCNIIHPGGCMTNINAGEPYHETGHTPLSTICRAMPVNGYSTPDHIANACAFLCSDEATWINGAVLSVDGGMSVC